PVHATVDLVRQLSDLELLRLLRVEIALTEEHAPEEQRGVDGRDLAVVGARTGAHVDEVMEESVLVRFVREEAQRRQHALACRSARGALTGIGSGRGCALGCIGSPRATGEAANHAQHTTMAGKTTCADRVLVRSGAPSPPAITCVATCAVSDAVNLRRTRRAPPARRPGSRPCPCRCADRRSPRRVARARAAPSPRRRPAPW